MAAATLFFLFAIVTGHDDGASLTTLGTFKDLASCTTAQTTITTALKTAGSPSQVFCVSANDISGLANAAHGAQ